MSGENLPEHSVLGTLVLPVAEVLGQRGIDALRLVTAAGIDINRLSDPGYRIPARPFHDFIRSCAEESGDESFGLHCAEALQPQALHGLGLAWLASDTVYDGLRRLVRFARLVASLAKLHLEDDGEFVRLRLQRIAEIESTSFISRDYGLAMVVRMCRLNLGQYISPYLIEIERPAPETPETWESMLGCRVHFDTENTCITWIRADIEDQIITGDPNLARVNDEQAEALIRSYTQESLARQVVDKILLRLPDGPPEQHEIASDLHVSNRTLQRKLREEGVKYSDLLQECRLQLAEKYLQAQGKSIAETSYLLGFAEPSAFTRAFKRWTNLTPAQFRDRAKISR